MKTLIILSSILFIFICSQSVAQQEPLHKKVRLDQVSTMSNDPGPAGDGISSNGRTSENYSAGQETGMYMYEEWTDGSALLADNTSLDDIQLRYNIYFRQMQFIQGEDTAAFSNPDEIKSIEIGGHNFIHTSYLNKDNVIDDDYFEILVDGKYQLLKRRAVSYHIDHDVVGNNPDDETFVKCCELYIKKGSDLPKQMNCSKRSIKSTFSDHEDEVMDFIKSNGLKIKEDQDLMAVVKFYNTLK